MLSLLFFALRVSASPVAAVTTSPDVYDPIESHLQEEWWWKKGCGGEGGGYSTIGEGSLSYSGTAYSTYFTSYFTETIGTASISYVTIPGEVTTVYYTPTPVVSTVTTAGASTTTITSVVTGPLTAYTTSYYVSTL